MHYPLKIGYPSPDSSDPEFWARPAPTTSIIGLGMTAFELPSFWTVDTFMAESDFQKRTTGLQDFSLEGPFSGQSTSFDAYCHSPVTSKVENPCSAISSTSQDFNFTPYTTSGPMSAQNETDSWYSRARFEMPTPSSGVSLAENFDATENDTISADDLESQSSHWSHDPLSNYTLSQGYAVHCQPGLTKQEIMSPRCLSSSATTHNARSGRSRRSETTGRAGRAIGRNFECGSCERVFDRRSNLKCHRKTHELERTTVVCDREGCTKTFRRRADMTRHIKFAHDGVKYTCQFCGKKLGRNDTLTRHMENSCLRERPFELDGMYLAK